MGAISATRNRCTRASLCAGYKVEVVCKWRQLFSQLFFVRSTRRELVRTHPIEAERCKADVIRSRTTRIQAHIGRADVTLSVCVCLSSARLTSTANMNQHSCPKKSFVGHTQSQRFGTKRNATDQIRAKRTTSKRSCSERRPRSKWPPNLTWSVAQFEVRPTTAAVERRRRQMARACPRSQASERASGWTAKVAPL